MAPLNFFGFLHLVVFATVGPSLVNGKIVSGMKLQLFYEIHFQPIAKVVESSWSLLDHGVINVSVLQGSTK
jgi:hypothetical protein